MSAGAAERRLPAGDCLEPLQKRDVSLVLCLGAPGEQQEQGRDRGDLHGSVSEQRIFRTSPVFVEVEVRAGGDDVAVQGPGT